MRKTFLLFILVSLLGCDNFLTNEDNKDEQWEKLWESNGYYGSLLNVRVFDESIRVVTVFLEETFDEIIGAYYPGDKVEINSGGHAIGVNMERDGVRMTKYQRTVDYVLINDKEYKIIKPKYLDDSLSASAEIISVDNLYVLQSIMSYDSHNLFRFYFYDPGDEDPSKQGTYACDIGFSSWYSCKSRDDYYVINGYHIERIFGGKANLKCMYQYDDKVISAFGDAYLGVRISEVLFDKEYNTNLDENVSTFFEYDDKIWAAVDDGESYDSSLRLWVSDDGILWEESEFEGPRIKNYFELNNKLCAYSLSCVYEFDLYNQKVYELARFEGGIVSVNISDDFVYVATKNSFYKKSIENFFENKSEGYSL